MNGQPPPPVNNPSTNNESSIGKFHVEKVQNSVLTNHEEQNHPIVSQSSTINSTGTNDESMCPSRFQMIRVDRNFNRGRWKVNDYEPPENTHTSINPPVNSNETESIHNSNQSTYPIITPISTSAPTGAPLTAQANSLTHIIPNDSNASTSAALTAAAAVC